MKRFTKKLFRPMRKKAAKNQGFTLLEILVALTVMGFLIAMAAPRLAGISQSASGTVCDTNKGRAKAYVSAFYEKFNRYPDRLTNLVMTDGATLADANTGNTGYQIPYCSDDDPENGPEVIHFGHNNAYKFMIHRLNQEEADELRSLGITQVYNLNDYAADADGLDGAAAMGRETSPGHNSGRVSNFADIASINDKRPFMESCPVGAGVGVAMCGCGIDLAGTGLTFVNPERGWAEEDIFARIIFGLGSESELVSSGIVTNAAHCPGSIQNADNFTWGGYYLILPRLEATADRLASATYAGLWGGNLNYARLSADTLSAVSWPKDGPKPSPDYDISANNDHFKVRAGLKLHEAMASWDFDTTRQRHDEVWGIDLNNSNNVLNGG
jgi:prepilin-type N-terminal cleavage/methylation domain-containing protein